MRGLLGFTSTPQAPLTIDDRVLRIEGDTGSGVGHVAYEDLPSE